MKQQQGKQTQRNKDWGFKNCASFTDCINETNNTLVNNPKDLDVVMPRYNLTEHGDSYSEISESLWKYYIDELMRQIMTL